MPLLFRSYPIIRKILFSLDPEKAHEITLKCLDYTYKCSLTRKILSYSPSLPKKIMGIKVKNPIGLAAGLDKNGEHIDSLGNLGFGFIEIGTVTPYPQTGNQKPRMFRLPKSEAIINRLGFNNLGINKLISNVRRSNWRKNGGILGINIGKNATTKIESSVEDYLKCLNTAYNHADYITINISSPNTEKLRSLQEKEHLNNLLYRLVEARKSLSDIYQKHTPIALKISPDLELCDIDIISEALVKYRIEGVITTNTTISRNNMENEIFSKEKGGLSGYPLHELSLIVLERIKKNIGDDITIIGTGGILSAKQALEKIRSGADAVQIYTGLIYKGPILIEQCINAIKDD
ncbi:dihydroorotate oxidase [Candidatus Kinetoplastibacterium oncopeltii TCC290E]|uniref:Dihydroorotate dehydrogenase (quinone) n=1 Tax=Candidatus Kinetoplastidibacterium stringomonadis TCC290E TaxID=1208920 RepID=M1LZI1_9PROT|nr:quinone-dependent dihydroorotate dehydrogenase [Candidatus Kinetoplastibacterium oncopeltii]AGF48519.1 dihydroorotate oxidase [Candidatus Kinetoplastibacterium oncopeltii TCC290E]